MGSSLFSSLGDVVNVPTLTSSTTSVINSGAAQAQNFLPQNFSIPSAGKLTDELSNKLNAGGLTDKFKSLTSVGGLLNSTKTDGIANGVALSAAGLSGSTANANEKRVVISQSPAVQGGPNQVIFTVMPRIDESGTADYEALTPLHHPGAIQKYRYSSARTWGVSGRLISRTSEEASANLAIINMIRAWRMPFFGQGTGNDTSTSAMLGAPPPILTLSAYGSAMIGPTKCVLTSYNWNWDNALDWIPTTQGNPFPVILDISLSLVESWSPAEYSGFSLTKYKQGNLGDSGAFTRVSSAGLNTNAPQSVAATPPPATQATASTLERSAVAPKLPFGTATWDPTNFNLPNDVPQFFNDSASLRKRSLAGQQAIDNIDTGVA